MSASAASSSKGKGKAPAHSHFHEHTPDHHAHGDHEHEHGDGCCGASDAASDADAPLGEPLWPVVTAEEIAEEMEDQVHFMDSEVIRKTACISDMAGMEDTNVAVHRVSLAPGRESTVLHSHLAGNEWIYVLAGAPTLVLARTLKGDPDELRAGDPATVVYEETTLKAGDFAGFPGGPAGERWAHTLRNNGNEPAEYLLGGDRLKLDVITYPVRGQTLVFDNDSGAQSMF